MNSVPLIRTDYDNPNYDANRIAPYKLEDPLTFANGSPVENVEQWRSRRQEILDIFAKEMFGEEPPPPETLIIDKAEESDEALAGFAIRTQYKMYFRKDKSGPCINWLLYRPRYVVGPVPVIELLNYRGNHQLTPETEVFVTDSWIRNAEDVIDHKVLESSRGKMCNPCRDSIVPLSMLIAKGYAFLTACYAEVSPDPNPDEENPDFRQQPFAYTGVFELWGKRDENRTDNITALGAWAWALSRGLDLIEQNPDLDAKKVVVTGCSRLGKSAFLAAARDERFALCVANQCGGGGVTLAKRDFGENVATEMKAFTHWYCKAYKKYETNPALLLPFDQHLLVATIAPRPLLIEGFGSPWFDTEGEYLSCKAASCVWEFLGKPGLPAGVFPPPYSTEAVGKYLGFVHRTEKHGISGYDWEWLFNFAAPHIF